MNGNEFSQELRLPWGNPAMPSPDFPGLRKRLVELGVAPIHVRRTLLELGDHYDDLIAEANERRKSELAAAQYAADRLGDLELLARQVASRPELRCWQYRYPMAARIILPVAYLALLPTMPLFAGVAHASTIARWGASLMLGAAVTATMFLVLQVSIALS